MGPQLDSCGRLGGNGMIGNALLLQWGRNLIVAEGRLFLRGRRALAASMGPQLDSCGRLVLQQLDRLFSVLQWGRNLIVAEGRQRDRAPCPPRGLQWGRNLIVAEGQAPQAHELGAGRASMGPQLDSCGRL